MKNLPDYDLFALLGVSPQASPEEIKSAYRAAARRFHPDVNPHEGSALQFRDIAAAYEILGDEHSRASYLRSHKPAAGATFVSRCYASKRVLPRLDEAQVFYLLVEVHPQILEDQAALRHRLNIALVLDRSSSMRGTRLERVKVAAHQILEHMVPEDRLSIISFSDRADVLYPNGPVGDGREVRSLVNTIGAGGGTEIFQGLSAAYEQVERYFSRNSVNHIILITDGMTYGDEDQAFELAGEAREVGIGISAMGMGDEWNDEFLDELASLTGGSSAYINSPAAVTRFLENRIRSLGESFAERLRLTVAPDSDVQVESAFRLMPHAQPLDSTTQPIQLGTLEIKRPVSVLLQFQMPANLRIGFRNVVRLDVTGDILGRDGRSEHKAISDQSIEVSDSPPPEDPPTVVLDALAKLTLYRMQQKVELALTQGEVVQATRRLESLATRLLEMGHSDLAEMAHDESRRVARTRTLSESGRKGLKFGTRHLLAPPPQ